MLTLKPSLKFDKIEYIFPLMEFTFNLDSDAKIILEDIKNVSKERIEKIASNMEEDRTGLSRIGDGLVSLSWAIGIGLTLPALYGIFVWGAIEFYKLGKTPTVIESANKTGKKKKKMKNK